MIIYRKKEIDTIIMLFISLKAAAHQIRISLSESNQNSDGKLKMREVTEARSLIRIVAIPRRIIKKIFFPNTDSAEP